MSVARYPNLTFSGVDWMGDVPVHWGTPSLKRIVKLQSGETITAEVIEPVGTYPVYGGNGLRGYTENYTHEGSYVLIGRQGALCGNVTYAAGRFWASEHAIVVSARQKVALRWLGELLRAMDLNQYSTSAAQPGVSVDVLSQIRVPVPPSEEQAAIAAFLDRETAKIDALVEEQTRLIALLKEKRQAVISHAVTKGLNQDALMKPSGIEWLGDVPAHWEVVPLKRAFREVDYGISETLAPEGRVAILRMGNIEGGKILLDDLKYVDNVDPHLLLEDGDLLFNRTNSLDMIGKVGQFSSTGEGAVSFASYLVRLRLQKTSSSRFFIYILNTQGVLGEARARAFVAIGQCNLNPTRYGRIVIAIPPRAEQDAIAEYLAEETNRIDEFIGEARAVAALLQERRSALTSAAVTGKIDVRDLASQNTEAA